MAAKSSRMSTSALGIAIVALVGFWLLGGVLMRLGGTLLVIAGGAALAVGNRSAVVLLLAGVALWLGGRLHRSLRSST